MTLPKSPLVFSPVYSETIWGGTRLATEYGKKLPPGKLIGESWELSGFSSSQTSVASGPLQGVSLGALYSRFKKELVGIRFASGEQFPLLVKFIDARQPLSVQVHPDDTTAQLRFNEPCGKTECWYVASAGKNGSLAIGFNRPLQREAFGEAITTGEIEHFLNIIPVSGGDFFFIPAGTVHAIMGDVIIYEVQQTSNTTLRLYDWKRRDAQGNSRELHIAEGVAISNLAASSGALQKGILWKSQGTMSRLLVACRYFALEEFSFAAQSTMHFTARKSCTILSVMDGSVAIACESGSVTVDRGSTVLLPAILDKAEIVTTAGTKLLSTFIPDLATEIVEPLKEQGFTEKEISSTGAVCIS